MDDEHLEEIMDGWTSEEVSAAPALQPTAEMRRLVEARRPVPSAFTLRPWKWMALAVAAAIVLWIGRGFLPPATTIPESLHVSLHAPPPGLDTLLVKGPEPMKEGPKRRGAHFAQVLLQTYASGDDSIVGTEHGGEEPMPIPLDPDDLFRIALMPLGDCHVHVYVAASGEAAAATRVFPPEEHIGRGPLPGYLPFLVPSTSAWFHLEGATPLQRIIVVSSRDPIEDLEVPGALGARREAARESGVEIWEFVIRAR
jgi:hypothetical protein